MPSSKGFTLIELLVAVAIIGILTSIAIASFSSFNRGQTVKIAANEIKSALRAAQTDAAGGRKDASCGSAFRTYRNSDGAAAGSGTPVAPGPVTDLSGTWSGDNQDDYSLVGHFLIFDMNTGGSTPPNTQYRLGNRCQLAGPIFSAHPAEAQYKFSAIRTKQVTSGAFLNTAVAPTQGITFSGSGCIETTLPAGVTQLTIEFLGVNNSNSNIVGRVGFYHGDVTVGPRPFPDTGPPTNIVNSNAGTCQAILTFSASGTSSQYKVTIENNGNIYETKL